LYLGQAAAHRPTEAVVQRLLEVDDLRQLVHRVGGRTAEAWARDTPAGATAADLIAAEVSHWVGGWVGG
jgi:hypothetical protein